MNCYKLIGTVSLILIEICSPAYAKMSWRSASRPYVEVRSGEEESDAVLRASCGFERLITIRLGAEHRIGEGKGETVTVTIESDGKSAKLRGISKNSPDSEMTGGIELLTEIALEDPAVDILFSGKPVTITMPNQKRDRLLDADAGRIGRKFLKQCGV